jgi:hypothetical protein
MNCKLILSVALVLGCFVGQSHAGLIDNSTISILGTSSPEYPGYPRTDAIDLPLPGGYSTDFASFSQGTSTHLDFDFGGKKTFTQIVYTDRTSSGSSNGSNVLGTFDYVTQYQYIFSNDPTFATNVGTVTSPMLTTPSSPSSYLDFQTTLSIPNLNAQYVRWQVISTNGVNPGASNFDFYAAVPEPTSTTLGVIGATGLAGVGLLRRRKAVV